MCVQRLCYDLRMQIANCKLFRSAHPLSMSKKKPWRLYLQKERRARKWASWGVRDDSRQQASRGATTSGRGMLVFPQFHLPLSASSKQRQQRRAADGGLGAGWRKPATRPAPDAYRTANTESSTERWLTACACIVHVAWCRISLSPAGAAENCALRKKCEWISEFGSWHLGSPKCAFYPSPSILYCIRVICISCVLRVIIYALDSTSMLILWRRRASGRRSKTDNESRALDQRLTTLSLECPARRTRAVGLGWALNGL